MVNQYMICRISELVVDIPEAGGIAPRFGDYMTNEKAAVDIRINDELYKIERWPTLTEEQAVYMESGTQFYRALLNLKLQISQEKLIGKVLL